MAKFKTNEKIRCTVYWLIEPNIPKVENDPSQNGATFGMTNMIYNFRESVNREFFVSYGDNGGGVTGIK